MNLESTIKKTVVFVLCAFIGVAFFQVIDNWVYFFACAMTFSLVHALFDRWFVLKKAIKEKG